MTTIHDCMPATRQGQAHRSHLVAAGFGSAAITEALKAKSIVRLRRGVYGLAPVPVRARHLLTDGIPDVAYVAAARAAVLSLGADVVVARRTAAVLSGMDMLVEPTRVELRVRRGRAVKDKDLDVWASRTSRHVDEAVLRLDPIPMTTPVDTVLDCALARPMREAVVIADSALRRKLVTVEDLVGGVDARARHPRSTRLRRLLSLIDPESGSVLESVLRYLLVKNGYDVQSQFTVRRGKLFVGRFDFCLEQARVIIECDGRRWHDPDDVREKDRRKTNALTRLGWRVLRFTWGEVIDSPAFVLACIADCVALTDAVDAKWCA